MAVKRLTIPDLGVVTLQKRRGTRSIKLILRGDSIKVTMPTWVPYAQALAYIQAKKQWIQQNTTVRPQISDGSYIGKSHQLRIIESQHDRLRTRVSSQHITIQVPAGHSDTASLQQTMLRASERALKQQSAQLITPRVNDLALQHGFDYGDIRYKKLQSRWGSCDQQNNLTFNIFLVQLPWPLIDYVIVHELCHTKEHNHSKAFWALVEECIPNYRTLRKQLKEHHTHVTAME